MRYYGSATYKSIPIRTASESIPEITIVQPITIEAVGPKDALDAVSRIRKEIQAEGHTLYLEYIRIEGVRDDRPNRNHR